MHQACERRAWVVLWRLWQAIAAEVEFSEAGRQMVELGDRCLLLAGRICGRPPEAAFASRELEFGRVRLDQLLQREALRLAAGGHRSPSRWRMSRSA